MAKKSHNGQLFTAMQKEVRKISSISFLLGCYIVFNVPEARSAMLQLTVGGKPLSGLSFLVYYAAFCLVLMLSAWAMFHLNKVRQQADAILEPRQVGTLELSVGWRYELLGATFWLSAVAAPGSIALPCVQHYAA